MPTANKIGKKTEPIRTLKLIQELDKTAIIAGGYHRDLYNEVEYSDIDIFIDANKLPHGAFTVKFWENFFNIDVPTHLTRRLATLDYIKELRESNAEYDVAGSPHIETVYEMVKNEVKYNLILVNTNPIKYINKCFDFDICRTYCDGKKITFTKEFLADVENKTLTYTSAKVSTTNFNHAMHVHLAKLKLKYPDHRVVVPKIHKSKYDLYKPFL